MGIRTRITMCQFFKSKCSLTITSAFIYFFVKNFVFILFMA